MFSYFRENSLESVNERPSNDDNEPEMFKRAPRDRRRRWGWFRKTWNSVHRFANNACNWMKDVKHHSKSKHRYLILEGVREN
jgi:uncharacterized membrane protein YkvA (DUF1232 family)